MDWKAVISFVAMKIAPLPLFVVAATTGVLLFGGGEVNAILGTNELTNEFRPWFGVAFLICAAYLTGHALIWMRDGAAKIWNLIFIGRRRRKTLEELTEVEKAWLQCFLRSGSRSMPIPFANPIPKSLVAAGVLTRASSAIGNPGASPRGIPFDYEVKLWAWELINKEPKLIQISEQQLRLIDAEIATVEAATGDG